jgi:hypothetical protein
MPVLLKPIKTKHFSFINASTMKTFFLSWLLTLALIGAAQTKTETLTNANIISLHKAGLDDDIVLAKIDASSCKFDLSTDGLIALKSAGLSKEVIAAMQSKAAGRKIAVAKDTVIHNTPKLTEKPVAKDKFPVPETLNAIYFYDKDAQAAKSLERRDASYKTKKKMLGYGGVSFVYELTGNTSPVRMKAGSALSFIVNTGGPHGEGFILYKTDVTKSSRQAVVSDFGGAFNSGAKGSKGTITLDMRELKPGIYELIPSTKLEKGEYVFIAKNAYTGAGSTASVYAFGID